MASWLRWVVVRTPVSGINSVAISPNGKFIAYGDATKEIRVVDADTKKFTMLKGLWTSHNARIESLSWTPSSDVRARPRASRRYSGRGCA